MDNTVVIRTHNNLITCIIVQTFHKVIYVMCLYHMSAIILTDTASTDLTSISVEPLQIISNFFI